MSETMQASANATTVAAIYDAFGRGEIPAILERLAEDVEWEQWSDTASRDGIPWLKAGTGRDAVARFFEVVGELTIHEFAVLDIIGTGRQIAVEVLIDVELPNGGRYRDEELHLWTFDDAGKVSRMRHYVDTAKHRAAVKGEDATGS
jgi:uncharacterized protein